MKRIKVSAVETVYNGYRFRSRLEARWAVFFDYLGVEYEYEPEGFKLPSGKTYLPDFRVKCYGTRGECTDNFFDLYIEVKGRMTQEDADKIFEFCGRNDPDFWNPEINKKYESILVVGDIPNGDMYEAQSYDLGCYERMDGIAIYPWNYETIDGDHFACYPAVSEDGRFYLDGDDSNYQTMDIGVIKSAFLFAKQARFEYGETPKLRKQWKE